MINLRKISISALGILQANIIAKFQKSPNLHNRIIKKDKLFTTNKGNTRKIIKTGKRDRMKRTWILPRAHTSNSHPTKAKHTTIMKIMATITNKMNFTQKIKQSVVIGIIKAMEEAESIKLEIKSAVPQKSLTMMMAR